MRGNQAILDMGVLSKDSANKLLGTRVMLKGKNSNIHGVVSRVHGNSGKVVARFHKGLPGQAVGTDVEVLGKKEKKEVKKSPKKSQVKK